MPTYDYECTKCSHNFDAFQSMSEDPLVKCPSCGKNGLRRLIGGGLGVIFKGSGFYVTDSRGGGNGRGAKTDSESTSSDSSSESKSTPDSSSGASADTSNKDSSKSGASTDTKKPKSSSGSKAAT